MARFEMHAWNGDHDGAYECTGSSDDLLQCVELRPASGNWYVFDTYKQVGGLVDNESFATFLAKYAYRQDLTDAEDRVTHFQKRCERLEKSYDEKCKEKSDAMRELSETKDKFWVEQTKASDLEAKVRLLSSACRSLSDAMAIM